MQIVRRFPGLLLIAAWLLVAAAPAVAADSPVGTWVRQTSKDETGLPQMILIIERWGASGAKLTYRVAGVDKLMTISSPMDGSDVPVLLAGKPTGQTTGIKLVDEHHAKAVQKMKGKVVGTSTATLSEDFTKMTVENDFTAAPDRKLGRSTEVWLRR
jgi:hypothetical protein